MKPQAVRGPVRMRVPAVPALGLLLVVAGSALAAPPKPVADALAQLDSGMHQLAGGWRYQQKVSSDQGSETLAYDGGRPAGERWTVLTVNGKQPSPEKAKKLVAQARAAHQKGKSSADVSLGVGSWLQASGYRLVDSGGKQLVYQIRPRAGSKDSGSAGKLLRHLSGRLVVARDDHRPVKLTLDNFESFSPRFGVKVTHFELQIEFARLGPGQPVVTRHVSTEAKGKVFWLKSFDTRSEVTLSHFSPVAGSAPVPATAR